MTRGWRFRLIQRFELSNEGGKPRRRHGSGERVILLLKRASECAEPGATIASKRNLALYGRLLPRWADRTIR